MGCNVIDESLHLRSQASIREDLVNEAHEDLGGIPITKGRPGVLVQTQSADEGSLQLRILGKGDLPKS